MENNELDDLFRSNANYLADEPPRDFDKDAFWQQLNAELPRKTASRKKPAAWWWAAASVLLAGILGGIWWTQSAEPKAEKVANLDSTKVGNLPDGPVRDSYVAGVQEDGGLVSENSKAPKEILAKKEKHHVALPARSAPPELELVTAIKTPAAPLPVVENTLPLPEVVAPAPPEKTTYRVVHINEIRERKQQEAKARSRVAFRIGASEPPANLETTEDKFKLSIPIPH